MIRVRQIKIDVKEYSYELLYEKVLKKLKLKKEEVLEFKINKRSIDARDKERINYIFEVDLKLVNEEKVLKYKNEKSMC